MRRIKCLFLATCVFISSCATNEVSQPLNPSRPQVSTAKPYDPSILKFYAPEAAELNSVEIQLISELKKQHLSQHAYDNAYMFSRVIFEYIKTIRIRYYQDISPTRLLQYTLASIYKTAEIPDSTANRLPQSLKSAAEIKHYVNAFVDAYHRVLDNSKQLDDGFTESTLREILPRLDNFSSVIWVDEYKELFQRSPQNLGALGLEIRKDKENIIVVDALPGSPAEQASIFPGDMILSIDNVSTTGKTLLEVVKLFRGDVGSTTQLQLSRQGRQKNYTLVREKVKDTGVRIERVGKDKILVAIKRMTGSSASAIRQWFESQNAIPTGKVILDLRSNPGGTLASVIEIADLFIKQGNIIAVQGRTKDSAMTFAATPTVLNGMDKAKFVIMINKTSGSGPVILAQALRHHNNAIIVGSQPIKLATIQTLFPMANHSALKLSTSVFIFPNGESAEIAPLKPDYCVKWNKDKQRLDFTKFDTTQQQCEAEDAPNPALKQQVTDFSINLLENDKK